MSNVLKIVPNTGQSVEQALEKAKAAGLSNCVVLGWDRDGLCFMESTYEDNPPLLWLLRIAEQALVDVAFDK